jgi:hypothetical protein
MSAHVLANRHEYIRIVQDFVDGRIEVDQFVDRFLALRSQDLDRDAELKRSWTQPYDEILLKQFQDGKLPPEEFDVRWGEIWRYNRHDPWLAVFEQLFSDIELYAPDSYRDELSEEQGRYYINAAELRRRTVDHLRELRKSE